LLPAFPVSVKRIFTGKKGLKPGIGFPLRLNYNECGISAGLTTPAERKSLIPSFSQRKLGEGRDEGE
jgi:hypothetical protein